MTRRSLLFFTVLGISALIALNGTACPGEAPVPDPAPPDMSPDPSGDPPDGGSEELVPPPDVFAAASDPSQVVTDTTASGIDYTYPVNEMMLLLEESASQSEAAALASRLGGTIVGQVPDLGLYQIELGTDSSAELDVAIAAAELDGTVASAGYNLSTAFRQSCPSEVDNEDLVERERCPFNVTAYYPAATMFAFFRPHLQLHDVRVAVIDSGVDMTTGEFDDVPVVHLNALDQDPTDFHPDRHGTAVTGMIAADDDGSGVNGLASSMIPGRLLVLAGSSQRFIDEMVQTRLAIAMGARVVNLSIGWPPDVPNFAVYYESWYRMVTRHHEVIFVCAAGDEALALDGTNFAPGGIQMPNVITVGGLAQCEAQERYPLCNHGAVLDVAAPEEAIPVVSTSGSVRSATGTSFAAPQVTSLAAVLLSLDPSPSQVCHYMTGLALPSLAGVGRARLTFTTSIMELLIAIDAPEPVMGWIDPAGLGNAGSAGLVLGRVCPAGIHFTVSEYGTYDHWEPDDHVGAGTLGTPVTPPTFSLAATTEEEVGLSFGTYTSDFMLGTYAITSEEAPMSVQVGFVAPDPEEIGLGLGGSFTFDECRIEERDPFDGTTPWIVRASGEFEGILEVVHWDPPGIRTHEFEGYFSLPMIVTAGEGDPVIEYLEYHCDGGIPPDPPAAIEQ